MQTLLHIEVYIRVCAGSAGRLYRESLHVPMKKRRGTEEIKK